MSSSLKTSIGQSGLLFQQHPDINDWQATRALSPEIAAFRHDELTAGNRLSLKLFWAGETDADGWTYDQDTWIVEDRGIETDEIWTDETFTDRDEAIERLAELMRQYPEDDQ